MHEITNTKYPARVPEHTQKQVKLLNKTERDYILKHDKAPTIKELSQLTGLKEKTIRKAREREMMYMQISRLDAPANSSFEDDDTLKDLQKQDIYRTPIESLDQQINNHNLIQITEGLSDREKNIFFVHIGIGYDREFKLVEIGENFYGITRERTRQLYQKAKVKIIRNAIKLEMLSHLSLERMLKGQVQ